MRTDIDPWVLQRNLRFWMTPWRTIQWRRPVTIQWTLFVSCQFRHTFDYVIFCMSHSAIRWFGLQVSVRNERVTALDKKLTLESNDITERWALTWILATMASMVVWCRVLLLSITIFNSMGCHVVLGPPEMRVMRNAITGWFVGVKLYELFEGTWTLLLEWSLCALGYSWGVQLVHTNLRYQKSLGPTTDSREYNKYFRTLSSTVLIVETCPVRGGTVLRSRSQERRTPSAYQPAAHRKTKNLQYTCSMIRNVGPYSVSILFFKKFDIYLYK